VPGVGCGRRPHDLTCHADGVTLMDGPSGRVIAAAGKSLSETRRSRAKRDTTEAASRLTRSGRSASAGTESFA